MGADSKIEWCDHTFNPWVGCTKVSPACDHCYAEGWAKRTGQSHLWSGERRRTTDSYWRQPIKWNRDAQRDGVRRKVFCASLADVFDNQVPEEWRADLWVTIAATPYLDWLLLSKRPQNIPEMLPIMWGDGWPNVYLGTTVEDQKEADRRIGHLLSVQAAVHFLSCEPLLGRIHLPPQDAFWCPLEWVICGGESGPGARPMHPDWARGLRDQCVNADVPFFFKQWGEWAPCDEDELPGRFTDPSMASFTCLSSCGHAGNDIGSAFMHGPARYPDCFPAGEAGDGICNSTWMKNIGKRRAGALLDGHEWREFPQ